MRYSILLTLVLLVLISWIAFLAHRDRRRRHQRVREVISPEVVAELEVERETALLRKGHFEQVLHEMADRHDPS
ncbi:MAG: hypothetical protein HYV02_04910 [Deltaproteobacteria bacterium]|nr:hypothetical protein [Deltaproteobacteria bacterium]